MMRKESKPKSGTIEWLRSFKGFENYSDEAALKAIDSIEKLARILLPIVIDSIKKEEEEAKLNKK